MASRLTVQCPFVSFVALITRRVLLLRAKHLFIAAFRGQQRRKLRLHQCLDGPGNENCDQVCARSHPGGAGSGRGCRRAAGGMARAYNSASGGGGRRGLFNSSLPHHQADTA